MGVAITQSKKDYHELFMIDREAQRVFGGKSLFTSMIENVNDDLYRVIHTMEDGHKI